MAWRSRIIWVVRTPDSRWDGVGKAQMGTPPGVKLAAAVR